MINNGSEAEYAKHMKRIIERELWEIVETGSDNVKNIRVMDEVMDRDSTEYSSHSLA